MKMSLNTTGIKAVLECNKESISRANSYALMIVKMWQPHKFQTKYYTLTLKTNVTNGMDKRNEFENNSSGVKQYLMLIPPRQGGLSIMSDLINKTTARFLNSQRVQV